MNKLKLMLAAIAAMTMTLAAQAAKTPKVVLANDKHTLRFVYDEASYGKKGEDWFPIAESYSSSDDVPWAQWEVRSETRDVELMASFKAYRPTSCAYWFVRQYYVTNIVGIANLNTSCVTNMASMFSSCQKLTSLDVSGFDTSRVVDMFAMFADCYELSSLDVSGFDTAHVTNMRAMFSACSGLSTLNVSGLDVSSVIDMSKMFHSCWHVESFDLAGWDTSHATDMSYMFSDCYQLKTLDVSALNTASVTDMSGMFDQCEALTSLDLSGLDTSHVTEMSSMFDGCAALSSLDLSGWDTSCVTNMSFMFDGCSSLTALDVTGFDTSQVTDMRQMFDDCSSLAALDVSRFDTSHVKRMDVMFYACRSLTSLDLYNWDMSRASTSIADMFKFCSSLKSVKLPHRPPTSEKAILYDGMFAYCSELRTIYAVSAWDNVKRTQWSFFNTFYDCQNLVGGNGTRYDDVYFSYCSYARIDTPENPGYFTLCGEPVAVYSSAKKTLTFYCDAADHSSEGTVYSVLEADVPNPAVNPPWHECRAGVTKIVIDSSFAEYSPRSCYHWFHDFTAVTEISGLRYLDVSLATRLQGMFDNCSALTMLDLSAFDTASVKNMDTLFANCPALGAIVASEKFTTASLTNAGNSVFSLCSSLRGGYGTAYAGDPHYDAEYARLDASGVPGYFTRNAVAVLSSDASTLRFYCDGADHSEEGMVFSVVEAECAKPSENPPWYDACQASVTKVVFDSTFAAHRPRHCGNWFADFTRLTDIEGLEYLDLSRAWSIRSIFRGCSALTVLDLSRLDTSSVTDMEYMFSGCGALTRIDVTDSFTTAALAKSADNMFNGCTSLVGGSGTAYSSQHTSSEYARADLPGTPGYFALCKPVAVFSATAKTLTFHYDGANHASEGTVYSVADAEAQPPTAAPPWYECRASVTRVVFDKTFALYRPKHCGRWFYYFQSLESVWGLENLDVSEATSLREMFDHCSKLTSLDLTGFATDKVKDLYYAFGSCSKLATIYAGDAFVTTAVTNKSAYVFAGCTSLVGGNGTTYNLARATAYYARLDRAGTPGFFTLKPTAVAVYTPGDATLTFYCDREDHSGPGATVYSLAVAEERAAAGAAMPWYSDCRSKVTRVVFDNSFADYRPRNCMGWFSRFAALEEIVRLDNLNVSETVCLKFMFDRCSKLTSLDLTDFDTHSVTNMHYMFNVCSALKTVYATDDFTTSALASSSQIVFNNCPNLVGGNGTAYDSSKRTAAYARVDRAETPGYFTERLPVAVLSTDGTTLTFYCDGASHAAEGTTWSVRAADAQDPDDDAPWYDAHDTVTRVVFDRSFANYRPRHCGHWFDYFGNLESVTGLHNLDVSRATSLRFMFAGCEKLETVALDSFDTGRVTDIYYMFDGCEALRTITASEKFTTAGIKKAQTTFDDSPNLVGGNGTVYSSSQRSSAYARIDTAETPGYFTKGRTAVAVYANYTLTFYYDGSDHSAEGKVYDVEATRKEWHDYDNTIREVTFDASFADYRPKTCAGWFSGCVNLASVTGLENLDVSEATSLVTMFYNCSSLTTLDLTHFDTRNVTTFYKMFDGCSSLRTIYATASFSLESQTESEWMFRGCEKLVGGNGTAYADITSYPGASYYARIDGINQGYFTCLKAVAVYDSSEATLTFYYDGRYHAEAGKTVYSVADAEAIDPSGPVIVPWYDRWEDVERIVFDDSFADYRPRHCASWFCDFQYATEIAGLANLDVSQAISLKEMFYNCSELISLDLTGFDTARVTDMENMFSLCVNLETVYVSKRFVTTALSHDDQVMFDTCENLAGGAGTTYDDTGDDTAAMARIDGGPTSSSPGYFTEKVARAVYEMDGGTLTFYFDADAHAEGDEVYLVADAEAKSPSSTPPWGADAGLYVTVRFDASFADYRPAHCGSWFRDCRNVTAVAGLGNLNVSGATSLFKMFRCCSGITELDLSGFDTRRVADVCEMFARCDNLRTIYATEDFDCGALTEAGSWNVFLGCEKLVGGNGTSYAGAQVTGAEYARLDTDETPGYFTLKGVTPEPVEPGGEIVVPEGTAGAKADEINGDPAVKAQYLKAPGDVETTADYLACFDAVATSGSTILFVLNENGTNAVEAATAEAGSATLESALSQEGTLVINDPLTGFYYSLKQGASVSVGDRADLNRLAGRDSLSFPLTTGESQYFYQTLVTPAPVSNE